MGLTPKREIEQYKMSRKKTLENLESGTDFIVMTPKDI